VALRLLGWAAALTIAAGRARADGLLLMPADGDEGMAAHAITAHAAVARALEAQGVELISYAAARERAGGGELADCRALTCSAALCKRADAELAVLVAVRAQHDHSTHQHDPKAREVQVTLVEPSDARFFGKADVVRGDFSAAAREALLDARAYQLLGPGPHVRVDSTPGGADVSIDDELVGESPYRAVIEPGKHTVEIRLEGHKTQAQMIEVRRGAQQPTRLHAKLQPRAQASGTSQGEIEADIDAAMVAPPKTRSRPIVGPLILGVIGLGLITYDVVLIASAGCQRHEPTAGRPCTYPSEIDAAPAIAYGVLGVAALGTGIVWFLLGGGGDAQDASVSARVSPFGADLRARF